MVDKNKEKVKVLMDEFRAQAKLHMRIQSMYSHGKADALNQNADDLDAILAQWEETPELHRPFCHSPTGICSQSVRCGKEGCKEQI